MSMQESFKLSLSTTGKNGTTGSFASLFAWIETFHTLDEHLKYEDLIEETFLFEVLHQMDSRPLWAEPVDSANDSASQIHNASIIIVQLLTYYMDSLCQAIMIPILDVAVLINYKSDLLASQKEMHKIILLILGLAIQSDRKDEFISVMETLPASVKEDIMESYKELSGHLVRFDGREDLRKCCEDRLEYFKKYSHAMQEKHYLEAVVLSSQVLAGPDLLKSLKPPEGLVDFHGYQILLGSANQQAAGLTAQLEDKSAEVAQLTALLQQKREKMKRLKGQIKVFTVSDPALKMKAMQEEIERLKEALKSQEGLENELVSLSQRLVEFDFFKARVQELRDENSQLLEERQRAEVRLTELCADGEAAAERLAEWQLRYEEIASQTDAETQEAVAAAARLTAENRRLREALDALGGGAVASETAASASAAAAAAASNSLAPSLAAEIAIEKRIRDLESEVKHLMEAEFEAKQRADGLELQLRRKATEQANADAKAAVALSAARRDADESKLRADDAERQVRNLLAKQAEAEARATNESKLSADQLGKSIQRLLIERAKTEAALRAEEVAEAQRATAESERRIAELERRLKEVIVERAKIEAVATADSAALRLAVAESEQRVVELEKRLRRLSAKQTSKEAKSAAAEMETELVLQTSQDLALHLTRLASNNRALEQSCEKLKAELSHLGSVEQEVSQLREARAVDARELQRLAAQNRHLKRLVDSTRSPSPRRLPSSSVAQLASAKVAAATSKPSNARNSRPSALSAAPPLGQAARLRNLRSASSRRPETAH